jgi:hypothetical protein
MPRVASHHWHVVVDADNRPTPSVVEHEHMVNRGRRHAHYHDYATALAGLLELGKPIDEARLLALRLDGTASTTLSLLAMPRPSLDEQAIAASLHPEIRRSLS